MSKKLQKAISIGTSLATVIGMSGIAALIPMTAVAATYANGTLIKGAGDPNIYVVNNNLKVWVRSADVFNSSGYNWASIQTVSDISAVPDADLIKTADNPDVYRWENLFKRKLASIEIFNDYSLDWNKIATVTQSVMDSYPGVVLVSPVNSPDIYRVDSGVRQKYLSWAAFTGQGMSAKDVIEISTMEFGSYADGASIDVGTTTPDDDTVPPVTTGDLTVSLASSNPVSKNVSDGDGEVYLVATLTAGDSAVTVSSVTVKRQGAAGEAADFTKIWATVDGQRRTSERGIGSDDEVTLSLTVGDNNIVIPAGQSKNIAIEARMAGVSDAGHANNLAITAISSNAGTTAGLPIAGNAMSVAGIAASDLQYAYKGSNGTVNISDKAVQVGKIRLTNQESSKDITVQSINFRSNSSQGTNAGSTDVSKFKLYVTGITDPIATIDAMDSDNYIFFDLSSSPVLIAKGGSNYKEFTVKADINGGPSEYIELGINSASDIVALDNAGNKTDNTTSGTAKYYQIQGGTLTITESSDTPVARNVIDTQQDIVLLKANIIAAEEPVEISALTVNVVGSLTATEMENIKAYVVKEDGSQEEFGENSTAALHATDSTNAAAENAFTNTVLVEGTATLYVIVDLLTAADSGTLTASIAAADITATRTSDDASITATGSATGGTVTVVTAATLTVAAGTSPGAATKVKGQNDVLFGAFTLTATADTEVTVSSIQLRLIGTGGTADQQDVSDIELISADESTVYSGPKAMDASEDVTFSDLSNLPTITSAGLTVIVRGDINSTINASAITALNFQFVDNTYVEASDGVSDATIGGLSSAVNLPSITLSSAGTLNVEQLTGQYLASQVVSNSSDVPVGQIRLTAANETVNVKKLVLTVGATNGEEVETLYLYKSGDTSAFASAGVVGTTATFDSLSLPVKSGTSNAVDLTVKADFQSIETGYSTTSGTTITVYLDVDSTDLQAYSAGNPNTRVYGATASATTVNGVTLTATGTATTLGAAIISTSATSITVASATGLDVGNTLLVGSEHMLITAISGTTVTVRRGVAGSTAATASNGAAAAEYTQKITSNAHKYYGSKITVTPNTLTDKTFEAWSTWTPAFAFTITPDSASENKAVMNSVEIGFQTATGIGTTAATDWLVSDIRLKSGARVLETVTTDMNGSASTTTFGSTSLNEEIAAGGETFTVEVKIGGAVSAVTTAVDVMQLAITSLGSSNSAGTITAGKIDWDDSSSTQIQWIDQDENIILGNQWKSVR